MYSTVINRRLDHGKEPGLASGLPGGQIGPRVTTVEGRWYAPWNGERNRKPGQKSERVWAPDNNGETDWHLPRFCNLSRISRIVAIVGIVVKIIRVGLEFYPGF